MTTDNENSLQPPPEIPQGYRQGIITAITVFLGFSLAYFRFWTLETPGDWTRRSVFVAVVLTLAILLQIYALFRALRIADNHKREYDKTVCWFIASAVILLIGLVFAAVVLSAAH